jgi:hypothetical protein
MPEAKCCVTGPKKKIFLNSNQLPGLPVSSWAVFRYALTSTEERGAAPEALMHSEALWGPCAPGMMMSISSSLDFASRGH